MKVSECYSVCDICQGGVSLIVKIRIIERMSTPVTNNVCINCLTSKEFYYLDDDDVLKFNRVETTSSSSLSKKLGIK